MEVFLKIRQRLRGEIEDEEEEEGCHSCSDSDGVCSKLICLVGERAYACSCVNSTAKERLETHSAVFTGKVVDIGGNFISIFNSQQYKTYTLDVDTAWKGLIQDG